MTPECDQCPVRVKINLYNRAGQSPELAARLGHDQGLKDTPLGFQNHYIRTSGTLLIGCIERIRCPKF